MSNKESEFHRIVLCVVAAAVLAACQSTPTTVLVDANTRDPTAATALWMQADIPGKPQSNVYLRGSQGSSDISVEVTPTTVATITALATDNESGVQRLELFALVTIERVSGTGWFKIRDHVSNNFGGVTSTPVPGPVPFTARISTTIDFNTLSNGADWVVVDLAAVATSGASPASNTPAKTNVMTLFWKRAGTPP